MSESEMVSKLEAELKKKTEELNLERASGEGTMGLLMDVQKDRVKAKERIQELESHLPDCCKKNLCRNDEEMTVDDVVSITMNSHMSILLSSHLTDDQIVGLGNSIGQLTHKAVLSAIKDREAKIATARKLIAEVRQSHVESSDHKCGSEPCDWCIDALKILGDE
jgi:hypothetical protein